MKGNKNNTKVINEPITADTLEINQADTANVKVENAKQKPSEQSKKGKPATKKKDNAFVRFFKRIGRAFKEMWSELKKVSWPTFGKALASTGIVLAVVAIFLLVLMGMDALLGFGFNELIGLGNFGK